MKQNSRRESGDVVQQSFTSNIWCMSTGFNRQNTVRAPFSLLSVPPFDFQYGPICIYIAMHQNHIHFDGGRMSGQSCHSLDHKRHRKVGTQGHRLFSIKESKVLFNCISWPDGDNRRAIDSHVLLGASLTLDKWDWGKSVMISVWTATPGQGISEKDEDHSFFSASLSWKRWDVVREEQHHACLILQFGNL